MSLLQQRVDDGCTGYIVEYSPFPYDEASGSEHLPLIAFPGKKVLAPSASSLDNTWVHPEYARSLPKLCAADLLGVEVYGSGLGVDGIALATEELAVVWKLTDCDSLPLDLELLLDGPIPKCGNDLSCFVLPPPQAKKPLPLPMRTFRDLSHTVYSMRQAGSTEPQTHLLTRPWEAYLGFRIVGAGPDAWREPLWSKHMDQQLTGAASAAWASLLICRAMERSPGTTLVQPSPFLLSRAELECSRRHERAGRAAVARRLTAFGEPPALADGHRVAATRVLGTHADFDAAAVRPKIGGDVWTESELWRQTGGRGRDCTRAYRATTCTAVLTLLSVDRGSDSNVEMAVRPGLVPLCQVHSPKAEDAECWPERQCSDEEVEAYSNMLWDHRTKLERCAHELSGTASVVPFAEDLITVAPMCSLCDDELAGAAVSTALFPEQRSISPDVDQHMRLHAKRLREFVRVALRLRVAPFALITITSVYSARSDSSQQLKPCEKRPLRPPYSYEVAMDMSRDASNGGGGESRDVYRRMR